MWLHREAKKITWLWARVRDEQLGKTLLELNQKSVAASESEVKTKLDLSLVKGVCMCGGNRVSEINVDIYRRCFARL